jgi:hypothetical protein
MANNFEGYNDRTDWQSLPVAVVPDSVVFSHISYYSDSRCLNLKKVLAVCIAIRREILQPVLFC